MIAISKEDLIKSYITYKTNSYSVGFDDILKLDRVEKILGCHGWLQEAEQEFEGVKEELKSKREELRNKIVSSLKDYDLDSIYDLEDKIKPLKEDIRSLDRFGYIRSEAAEDLFKLINLPFFDRARILMKLGEVGI